MSPTSDIPGVDSAATAAETNPNISPQPPRPKHRRVPGPKVRPPTYLFRLTTPKSPGKTTTEEVLPEAFLVTTSREARKERDRHMFLRPHDEAGQRLVDHLTWKCDNSRSCNLMSWSSSLLFILQYGFYRLRSDYKTGGALTRLSNINILILDTRGFPSGTFIQDLEALRRLELPDNQKWQDLNNWRTKRCYFGEYLSQGWLATSGRCCQTSLQKLVDSGLGILCPDLMHEGCWEKWTSRVDQLRAIMFPSSYLVDLTDDYKKRLHTALHAAETCYGGRWTLPVAVMLLSLQPVAGKAHFGHVVDALRSLFTDAEMKEVDLQKITFDPESDRQPELKQYRKFILALCDPQNTEDDDDLISNMETLSVDA